MNISGVGELGVGETGVGEMGQIIGKTGVGEMGVGETGTSRCIKLLWRLEDLYHPSNKEQRW